MKTGAEAYKEIFDITLTGLENIEQSKVCTPITSNRSKLFVSVTIRWGLKFTVGLQKPCTKCMAAYTDIVETSWKILLMDLLQQRNSYLEV